MPAAAPAAIGAGTPTSLTPLTPEPPSPTPALLAPSIGGPTATAGAAAAAGTQQALIPVTGADLTASSSDARLVMINRIHQLQTGMNFLGFGLMLIGSVLMIGKKEDDEEE